MRSAEVFLVKGPRAMYVQFESIPSGEGGHGRGTDELAGGAGLCRDGPARPL